METIVETTRMSTKGQLVIPRKTRKYTQAESETIFTVSPLDKNTIILKKMDTQKLVSEFQRLRASVKDKLSEEQVDALVHKNRKKA